MNNELRVLNGVSRIAKTSTPEHSHGGPDHYIAADRVMSQCAAIPMGARNVGQKSQGCKRGNEIICLRHGNGHICLVIPQQL